ncbi:MAG: hypothetical protein HYW48_01810 [Deltaproteobacteria bacterium]|nr:hypothetical protein [Deltaproteobacteria bacterium]
MEEPAAQFPPNHLLAPSGLRITEFAFLPLAFFQISRIIISMKTIHSTLLSLTLLSCKPETPSATRPKETSKAPETQLSKEIPKEASECQELALGLDIATIDPPVKVSAQAATIETASIFKSVNSKGYPIFKIEVTTSVPVTHIEWRACVQGDCYPSEDSFEIAVGVSLLPPFPTWAGQDVTFEVRGCVGDNYRLDQPCGEAKEFGYSFPSQSETWPKEDRQLQELYDVRKTLWQKGYRLHFLSSSLVEIAETTPPQSKGRQLLLALVKNISNRSPDELALAVELLYDDIKSQIQSSQPDGLNLASSSCTTDSPPTASEPSVAASPQSPTPGTDVDTDFAIRNQTETAVNIGTNNKKKSDKTEKRPRKPNEGLLVGGLFLVGFGISGLISGTALRVFRGGGGFLVAGFNTAGFVGLIGGQFFRDRIQKKITTEAIGDYIKKNPQSQDLAKGWIEEVKKGTAMGEIKDIPEALKAETKTKIEAYSTKIGKRFQVGSLFSLLAGGALMAAALSLTDDPYLAYRSSLDTLQQEIETLQTTRKNGLAALE